MTKNKNKKVKVIRLTYDFIVPADLKKIHIEKLAESIDKLIVKTLKKVKIETQKSSNPKQPAICELVE